MIKSRLKMLSAGLAATLMLVSVPSLSMADSTFPENTIQVQGSGQVSAKPDAMNLGVAVETEARTLEEARNQNALKMTKVTQAIKGLGIPGLVLQTSYFNVYPVRKKDNLAPTSYRASNNLSVKLENVTDADKLTRYASQVMDTAMANGANNVNGPNFYLSETNVATQEALKLAVDQAKRTAQTLAAASGVTISGVYNIETYSHGTAMKSAGAVPMMARADYEAAPTPVEAGEFDVSANVTIRFDFRD